jgi:putative transposase
VSYVLMPNHWHLVVWPQHDGQLSTWAQWLTVTHVRRWHAHHHSAGTGPVYQGRFKSFPVQEDEHYFTVCRSVERNPLRATLVARAEAWRWSSLWHRVQATGVPWLSDGPLPLPGHWTEYVNGAQTEGELAAVRTAVARGAPFGDECWQKQTAVILGLESALRRAGRPKKITQASPENLT